MKTKKNTPDPVQVQERTEIWKQVIITIGVVVVALIGSWQAIAIVQLNNKPPSPAPSAIPVAATSTPGLVEATNTSPSAIPVVVVATTGLSPVTNTAPAKSLNLKPVNIDPSKWYRLTNESLGKNYSLDHWNDTKAIVMNTINYIGGQNWRFNVSDPGYYTLTNEFYGQDIFLNVLTDNNNSLNLSPGTGDPKNRYWKVTSSNENCVRFTSQGLGDDWSLDFKVINNIPTPYMAQTSDTSTQCWHLTQAGSIK